MRRRRLEDPQAKILKRFQAIAESGVSFEQLLNEYTGSPAALSDVLLRRAALVRSIGRQLYEEILLSGISGPAFDVFRKDPAVERAGAEACCLRDSARRKYLGYWRNRPAELIRFSSLLEDFHARTGASFDRFLYSLFARPATACARFLKRYRELDEAFALSGCEALLRVLGDRLLILSDDLRDAVNEREQYLRSRTLFAEDYYRTVVHLKREGPASQFEEFLENSREWILHLHGGGGVGKTVFLRWLIARRCIREQKGVRIPVARIDIDAFDRRGLGEYPLLVFLPLMKQLTRQLPLNPFQSYLLSLSDCDAMLARPSSRESQNFRVDLKSKIEAQQLFIAGLPLGFASAIGSQKVLVVLDTIEDMLLHQRAQLLSILNLLSKVHEECSGFRLVLSGRYDLTREHRLPEFAAAHEGEFRTVEISNFTEEESTRYLSELRKIAKPAVVEAIWKKTKGHPLDLTLLGDIATADPDITAGQIRQLPQQYARLIERIIDRIPDEQSTLRWLLRYAVVSRRLDLDYVLHVINQPVQREARGKSVRDNPRNYPDPRAQRRYGHDERWKALSRIELKKAWSQLLSYAAQTSWVNEEHGVVRLQPEIVEPMRALLRINPIYHELQGRSQRHFERMARTRPDWGEWIAEAVYHRFQREIPGAGAYWVKQLRAARRKGFGDLEQVAGVVFGPEFLDDKKRARVKVSRSALARATYDLAYATLVRLLRLPNRDADFPRLAAQLGQRWQDLQDYSKGASRAVSKAHRSLIRAAHLAYNGGDRQHTTALHLALAAARRLGDDPSRLAAEMLIAARLYWLNRELARPHFEEAYRIAARSRSRDLPSSFVDRLLARNYLFVDNLEGAAKHFLRAWHQMNQPGSRSDPTQVFRRAAETLFEAADWREAMRLQKAAWHWTERRPSIQFQWLYAEARLRLKLGEFESGLISCERATGVAQDLQDRGVQAELAAEFEAARFRLEEAKALFELAEGFYSQAGSPAGIPTCRLKMARMYKQQAGDSTRCREVLDSAGLLLPTPALRLEAMRLKVRAWVGVDRMIAIGQWKDGFDTVLKQDFSPRARAGFLVLGLALGLAREPDLKLLWPLLAKIRPASAVYGVLEEFELCFSVPAWADRYYSRIARYAPNLSPKSAAGVLHAMAFASAMHFFGRGRQSAAVLRRCLSAAEAFPGLVPRIREALFRVDPAGYQTAPLPQGKERWIDEPADPFHLHRLEEAERAWGLDQRARAAEWLELCPFHEWPKALVRSEWGIRANLLSAELAGFHTKEGRRYLLSAGDIARDLPYPLPDWAEAALKQIATHAFSEEQLGPDAMRVRIEQGESAEDVTISWSSASRPEQVEVRTRFPDRSFAAAIARESGGAPVQLTIATREFENMPWESSFPEGSVVYRVPRAQLRLTVTIRCLQSALVRRGVKLNIDGILGPETSAALRRVGSADPGSIRAELLASAPAAGAVLIVQPDLEEERYAKRGHGMQGIRVADLYAQHKLTAYEHVYRDPLGLRKQIEATRPAVIHLVTGFWQNRNTDILPDVARQGSEPLSARALAALTEVRPGMPEPILILECVTPPTTYDVTLQGVSRNRYCTDLFAAGNFKAIFATGLWPHGETLPALDGLLNSLAKPASLGGMFLDSPRSLLWPPALFTCDPGLPVWEP